MSAPWSPSRYSGAAVALHWLLAGGLAAAFLLGLYMTGLPVSPARLRLYNWHKWAGMVLLALAALRLIERCLHRPPPDPPVSPWQRRAAHLLHRLLHALGVAVPLAGWAYSSAAGFPVVVFGVLPMPDLLAADRALADALRPWHADLAWLMAALVGLHVAAALKHQWVDRDHLMSRMWFGGARR